MRVRIKHLRFLTFVKLCLFLGVLLGFAFGAFTLVAALFGGHAYANLFAIRIDGIPAGFVNLIWAPIVVGSLTLPATPLLYIPFLGLLRITGGLSLRGEFEFMEDPAPLQWERWTPSS